jgi:hypothetical protein
MRSPRGTVFLDTFYISAGFAQKIYSAIALLACTALLLTGCGSGSGSPPPPPPGQAVAITVQPLSQTVPIGETATFTVTATGTAPLSYQWSEDGVEIAGATSASYTTPAIALDESGSTSIGSYQVTVSNASSSATSSAAALTAGPRSPKAGDLRYLLFEQVDIPGMDTADIGVGDFATLAEYGNALGTPLQMGMCSLNDGCGWSFTVYSLPTSMTGLTMWYNCGFDNLGNRYPSIASDLQSIAASNVVITSLDIEAIVGTFAVSWVETAQAGRFDYRLEVVPQAQMQATVAADGAESRVITAVSFDALGNANLISYGWTGDSTTVYETQTVVAAPDNVANQATILADEGYAISAFGGNDTDGYILVGTRVAGDTLPRPVEVTTRTGITPPTNPSSAYYTTVAFFNGGADGYAIIQEQ